jgi:hypothetical protein
MITEYENLDGNKMIKVEHEDGSCTCYTEQQYADYVASQAEQSTPIVTDEAETK